MKPKTQDNRRINLQEVMSKDYIPWQGGRPQRDNVINDNDVLNLKIALHTFKSLEDFLELV